MASDSGIKATPAERLRDHDGSRKADVRIGSQKGKSHSDAIKPANCTLNRRETAKLIESFVVEGFDLAPVV
jgi:hypothetical protein